MKAKAIIKINESLTFEIEGEEDREVFAGIASVQEIFSERRCGLCGCQDLRFVVRKNKEGEPFHELHCVGVIGDRKERCRGYLAYGQNRKGGGLFPIRALTEAGKPDREAGKFGRHNGWTRFRGDKPQQAPAGEVK